MTNHPSTETNVHALQSDWVCQNNEVLYNVLYMYCYYHQCITDSQSRILLFRTVLVRTVMTCLCTKYQVQYCVPFFWYQKKKVQYPRSTIHRIQYVHAAVQLHSKHEINRSRIIALLLKNSLVACVLSFYQICR